MTVTGYWHVSVLRLGLFSDVRFGVDLNMYNGAISCFMAPNQPLPCHHGHNLQQRLKMFIIIITMVLSACSPCLRQTIFLNMSS